MPTTYIITITKCSQEEKLTTPEWKQGVRPESPSDYGYTPQVSYLDDSSQTIYAQCVSEEDFDLKSIIRAVNEPESTNNSDEF